MGWFSPQIAARTCAVQIPDQRVLYAASTAFFAAVTVIAVGVNATLWAWLAVALIGAVLAFVDLAHHRLPDRLVGPLYLVVMLLLLIPSVTSGDWAAYLRALLGAVAMFVAYFLLALIYPAGMGMGDVKLAGALGLALGYLGWAYVIVGFLAAFFLGSFVGLALLALRRVDRKTPIPFGPFMIVGSVLAVVLTGGLAQLYSSGADVSSAQHNQVVKH